MKTLLIVFSLLLVSSTIVRGQNNIETLLNADVAVVPADGTKPVLMKGNFLAVDGTTLALLSQEYPKYAFACTATIWRTIERASMLCASYTDQNKPLVLGEFENLAKKLKQKRVQVIVMNFEGTVGVVFKAFDSKPKDTIAFFISPQDAYTLATALSAVEDENR